MLITNIRKEGFGKSLARAWMNEKLNKSWIVEYEFKLCVGRIQNEL